MLIPTKRAKQSSQAANMVLRLKRGEGRLKINVTNIYAIAPMGITIMSNKESRKNLDNKADSNICGNVSTFPSSLILAESDIPKTKAVVIATPAITSAIKTAPPKILLNHLIMLANKSTMVSPALLKLSFFFMLEATFSASCLTRFAIRSMSGVSPCILNRS